MTGDVPIPTPQTPEARADYYFPEDANRYTVSCSAYNAPHMGIGWFTEPVGGRILPDTMWYFGAVGPGCTGAPDIEAQNHPARWPYKLAEDIVRCFCPPGGLACDPFVGAGTSAAAAVEHGRRFVGGDLGSRVYDPTRPHLDAVPWVTVTERVLRERAKQAKLFAAG